MSWWLKFKAWVKLITVGFLTLFILVFIFKNNTDVTIWLWNDIQTTVMNVVLVTMLVSIIGTLLVWTTFGTLRQLRAARLRAAVEQATELRQKAAQLQTRPTSSETGPPGL
jgi:uncharacterized integral membrane protein